MSKIKLQMPNHDELHACGMVLLELLLEQKRDFTGDNAVTVSIPCIMPDNSKRVITIAVYEENSHED